MTSPHIIDARFFGKLYQSRRRQEVADINGEIVAQCSIVPPIVITDFVTKTKYVSSLSLKQRFERLIVAGNIYANNQLAGLEPKAYIELASKVSGLDPSIIQRSMIAISYSLKNMSTILQSAIPHGSVWEINDKKDEKVVKGCGLFSRRGHSVSIITAGNGPGSHGIWPQAIALGFQTLVKPSFNEPFTAERLTAALEAAELTNYIAFIPTDHSGSDTLISGSDLAIIYGGESVTSHYANNPSILLQGPGRSKIVVGRDVDRNKAVETAAVSIMSLGGAACVSTSAVLVEEAHEQFALKLEEKLNSLNQPEFNRFISKKNAETFKKILSADSNPWHYSSSPATQRIKVKPHICVVDNAKDPRVQRELPFPCVTVAPFNFTNDYPVLSESLVVTLLTQQQDIIDTIINDSTVANVYIGNIPTTWMDIHVPHDGYLADFLMRNRGIKIDID